MSAQCKAILIDPFTCTVTEVDHTGDFRHIYELLSHATMLVDTFESAEVAHLYERDAIFVPEQDTRQSSARWFSIHGASRSYAGKGFVIGTDGRGFSKSAMTPIASIRERVVFFERKRGALLATDRPYQG